MKKILALVLALAMIMMVGAVYADPDETPATPATAALPKADISISNMQAGDKVTLYKVIKWDTTAADWAFDGITVAEPYETVEKLVAALKGNDSPAAMTALTAAVAGKTVENSAELTGTTYTYNAEVGSYLALVEGANGYVYNPMVLSVNFTDPTTGAGGTINAATAVEGTSSVAKKQPITSDKEVEGSDKKNDVAVGDTIPFLVHTVTPNYGENYTNPVFTITDALSTGLTMTEAQQSAIKVVVDGTDPEKVLVKGTDYTIETSASGYTISFSKDYLHTVKAQTAVTVKYEATVNEKAVMHNVEQYDNKVDIVYSNSPTTADGHDHDETHHYTFSIDASLVGSEGGENITKELVKIGRDAVTGEMITKWNTLDESSWTNYGPLEGATFTLVGEDKTYTATSDEGGFLTFTGLDAGEYTLTETSAPAGYKFSTAGIPVVISANYDSDGFLTDYTITVNGENSSTYTASLDGNYVVSSTTIDRTSETTGIINEEAVTLPSTGGIGTTIFYVLGGLLVVGAAVILVARRKAHE